MTTQPTSIPTLPPRADPLFCIQNKEPPKCPPEVVGKTGKEVCNQEAYWIAQAAAKVAENISNLNPITAIMNGVKAKSDSMQVTINKLNTKLSTISITDQDSRCSGQISQVQSNVARGGILPACLDNYANLPKFLQDKIAQGGNISNLVQTNTANAQNFCKIDLVLTALTEMDASIDNSTLQEVVNKAKGILSGAKSEQMVCNDIGIEMSACKYINQTQCCNQEILQDQTNLLETECGGSFNNVIQSNTANAVNQCMLSAVATVSTKMKGAIKNVVTQSAENTAEGLTLDFFIIMIIIFCLLFGAPFLLFKYMLSKIFYIAGGIFIIASVICGVVYITSKKSGATNYNKPYSGCTSFRAFKSMLERKKYGELKKFVEKNDKVIGYDFFVDLPIDSDTNERVEPTEENIKSKVTDETEGSVLYMTVRPKDNDSCISDEETAVISYIKEQSKPRFLIISIVLLIVGIAFIGVGFFKDYQTSKHVPLAKTEPLLGKTETLGSSVMKKFSKPTTTNSETEKIIKS